MDLPLPEDRMRAIVAQAARLRAAYPDAFAKPALVEPNGDYFPDAFALEPASIARLLARMLTYAPVPSGTEVGLAFLDDDETAAGGGSCGSGACGDGGLKTISRGGAVETETGYQAVVHVRDVGDPTILTTVLARAIGRVVLFEAGEDALARDEGAESELAAILSGLGVLVLSGSCVYKKGCGGMKRHQATFLEVEEAAFALALFVRVTAHVPAAARRHLEVTQREAFDAALSWVDSQPALVEAMRDRPETLEDGIFVVEGRRGLFARLFGKRQGAGADFTPLAAASARAADRPRSEEDARRLAEAKALVEQALSEP